MKISKYKFTLIATTCLFMILLISCKKNFESINNDPNNPEEVPNSYYLASAERGLMDNTCDYWWGGQVGNQLAQYWSSNQYTSESRYQFRTGVTNIYWTNLYAGGLNDEEVNVGGLIELQKIIENCIASPATASRYGFPANQIAVATILKVWVFQNMTDTWGDIPYSQALNPETYRSPKYDSQSSIYSGLLGEINSAISSINTSEDGPAGDLIYSGDMTLWSKFGNAVKMRLAIRMADRDNATAKSAFESAATAGTFTSNADNALMPYGEGAANANPIWYNYTIDRRNDFAASNIMLDLLVSLNDPRLPYYYAPAESDSSWTGEVYGLNDGDAAATPNSSISQRSALVLSETLPGIFMDYSQVEFMMAEAVERGWAVTGTAQSHYDAAVGASIEFWTELNGTPATATDISTYLALPGVTYLSTDSWQEKIGKQKWIALYNQGMQGWIEYRRLDFGVLQLPADGVLEGTGIPTRMKYSVDEQTLNSTNYSAASASMGGDTQNSKVWWDVF
jgi:hypothetical protein